MATKRQSCVGRIGEAVTEGFFLMFLSPAALCYAAYHESPLHKSRKTKKEHHRPARQLIPPSLLKRDRPLTPSDTLKFNYAGPKLRTKSQVACPLFGLPYELRLSIYENLIGTEHVHVVWIDGKFLSFRCWGDQLDSADGYHRPQEFWWEETIDGPEDDGGCRLDLEKPGIRVLSLLRTCRSVYTELVPLIYSKPTFIFHNWSSLLAFSASLLPQRFNTLTSVRIDAGWTTVFDFWVWEDTTHSLLFPTQRISQSSLTRLQVRNALPSYEVQEKPVVWTAVCDVLARMKGLKKLEIDLASDGFGMSEIDHEAVLKPLVEVGRKLSLRTFDLNINWKEKEDWKFPQDAPFAVWSRRPLFLDWLPDV